MTTIPMESLTPGATNVPITPIEDWQHPSFAANIGASRYRHSYDKNAHLDTLLVNKGKNVLVVSLHGALHRSKYQLPRFEWLSTLLKYEVNSMYFGDPTLWLDETLLLGWYTGWEGVDAQTHIAEWIIKAAEITCSDRIVILGSSGGGFAALQISALVPNSVCVPFNPSTTIHGYLVNGDPNLHGTERKFIEIVYPDAAPEGIWKIDWDLDWTENRGDHLSVLRRYSKPVQNWIFYVSNPNEWHFEQHYLPFLAAAARGNNLSRIRVREYEGRKIHTPPRPHEFHPALKEALAWRPWAL